MAYAFRRDNKGEPAYTGIYEGPDGRVRSAQAAVGVGYSPQWSVARRTARAFSCGSIFFVMLLVLLDSNRSSIKPGAPHLAVETCLALGCQVLAVMHHHQTSTTRRSP